MGFTVLGVSAATAATLAATAASAATGVAGALAAAKARSDNDNYQAQVARNNATVATQNATLATQQADAKVQGDYRATALKTGAQRAALGADGGTLDTGSAADVQATTAEYGQLAANNDQYGGQLQSAGYTTQAANFTAQAGMDNRRGRQRQHRRNNRCRRLASLGRVAVCLEMEPVRHAAWQLQQHRRRV